MGISEGDQLTDQLDLTYEHDPAYGFYPIRWRWVTMSTVSGNLRKSDQSTLSEHNFTPEVRDADFRIEFPVGCLVFDGLASEPTSYLVLPDGGKRPVLDEEWRAGVPVETLMETEPGEPLAQSSSTLGVWFTAGLSAGALLIIAGLVWRRLRKA